MREDNRSVTTQGITGPYFLLVILSVAGMALSLYLTNYYMGVKFPQGLAEASACDINSFFNCDASSHSPFSNIFGLPVSVLGFLFSINILMSCIFPSAAWERANHGLAWVNVLGCLVLFLYTLFVLQTVCPFCMGYWIVAVAIALLLWKKGLPPALPAPSVAAIYVGLAALVIGGFTWNLMSKQQSNDRSAYALIQQFKQRAFVLEPDSPHKIHMGTENFEDAPLRVSEFSDFQCPACLRFAELILPLVKRYRDKINIQYLFYPLDHNCNAEIKQPLHPMACQAAVLAHCAGEQFATVHDEIFAQQSNLTQGWMDQRAAQLGVQECQKSPEAMDFVKSHIELGRRLEVTSTPTLIVNGKKIPGGLQLQQFFLLFDQILKGH